jgi:hypothetical protein
MLGDGWTLRARRPRAGGFTVASADVKAKAALDALVATIGADQQAV